MVFEKHQFRLNLFTELPWMISIRDYLGFPFCGGTILTPEYSITAAHCREFRRLKEYKITTGHLERGKFQKFLAIPFV